MRRLYPIRKIFAVEPDFLRKTLMLSRGLSPFSSLRELLLEKKEAFLGGGGKDPVRVPVSTKARQSQFSAQTPTRHQAVRNQRGARSGGGRPPIGHGGKQGELVTHSSGNKASRGCRHDKNTGTRERWGGTSRSFR